MAKDVASAGRNDPCPCGSGKKYKHCHALKSTGLTRGQWLGLILGGAVLVGGLVLAYVTREDRGQPTGVWSAEHGHYH
jgi:hypothetical protein